MAVPVIEIRGVTKAFGELEVLRGVDLAVHEHEAVAVIGASGSGKSTLLRCVDLLEEIDDGDIFLDGEVVTDPSVEPVAVRRRLGHVFQSYNLISHLNALQNIVLGEVHAHGIPRAEAEARARALLARFGLAGEAVVVVCLAAPSSSGWRSSAPSPRARGRCSSTRSRAPSTPSWSARSSPRCAS